MKLSKEHVKYHTPFLVERIWMKGRFQRDFPWNVKEKTNEFQNKDN